MSVASLGAGVEIAAGRVPGASGEAPGETRPAGSWVYLVYLLRSKARSIRCWTRLPSASQASARMLTEPAVFRTGG